jgi:hypothetical protein
VLSTDPIKLTVKRGRVGPPEDRAPPDPMQRMLPPLVDDHSEDRVVIPRRDSDLFLRASVDQTEVYVGEQVTLSVYIYSRVDLSSVDTLQMPKTDGFWSEDIDSPSQLSGEQKVINGIPYRAYLLRRRALFPVKAGTRTLNAPEADVTTGFLFAGRRLRRVGNELKITAKALPPGKPKGFPLGNVGEWRLSADVSQTQVELGQPVTVKVILEGRGNLKNVTAPNLEVPAGLRMFDPTTTSKAQVQRGKLGGRRTQEYLVMPQQTGSFTLPALTMSYFDPDTARYEQAAAEPILLTVVAAPSDAGAPTLTTQSPENTPKNILAATALKPLRYAATFQEPRPPLYRHRVFWPALLMPVALAFGSMLYSAVRRIASREDASSVRRKRAHAARRRLASAQKLKETGSAAAFYGEVEKALLGFLEARLGTQVLGLTRDALSAHMHDAAVPVDALQKILSVLDACDTGRFAPATANGAVRSRVLEDAVAAMESWRTR